MINESGKEPLEGEILFYPRIYTSAWKMSYILEFIPELKTVADTDNKQAAEESSQFYWSRGFLI